MNGAAPSATGPSRQARLAVAAAITLFGLLAAHTLLEVGRDSLFLTRLPVEQLPFAYLTIAAAAAIGASIDRRLPERYARHLPRLTLLGGALLSGAFFVLFDTDWAFAPHAFYVGTGMIATLAVAQFWRLLTELFTVAEAKRIYTRVAAVGSLGAMAGAAGAELALHWIDARGLLLIGGAVYVITAVVPHAWLSNAVPSHAPRRASADASDRMSLRTESYLRQLLVLLALAATTATLVDYLFKAAVDAAVTDQDLPHFLSRFHLGLNFLSVVVQLVIAPRIFRARGVTRGLVILPVLVLFGAGLVLSSGGLVAALLLRGADGSLRNSLYRSAIELLYFPLSRNVRSRFKALVDAVGHRAGQTIGSLGILLATYAGLGPRELAVAVGVLALGSLALAVSMRGGYVALFREHLRGGAVQPVPELDLRSLEHLIASLDSDDEEEVLASLKLLRECDRVRLVPKLLLLHPSPRVVVRVLEMFEGSGRTDFAELGRRLLDHSDPDVEDAAARALASVLTPAELRAALEQHHDAAVNVAVLVTMITRGLDTGASAEREVRAMLEEGSRAVLLAVVRAVRSQRAHALGGALHGLIERAERDGELRRELAQAFEALRDASAVPTLIGWLGPRQARAEARAALVAIGEAARGPLEAALNDAALPRALRAHLPRTLAHFRDVRAARTLLDRLEHEPDGWVRYKILRALRVLRDALPDLDVPKERLRRQARESLERAASALAERIAVREMQEANPSLRTPGGELLEPVLREKEDEAIDRAVRLLCLTDRHTGAASIRRALHGADPRLRAESRELLGHIAEPASLSESLLALLEETDDRERLSRAAEALELRAPRAREYEVLVCALMEDPSDAVRAIATHHAAELGFLSGEQARAREGSRLAHEVTRA